MKLERANNGIHKYIATFSDGKTTSFGQAGANDFTLTGDVDARTRYRQRHRKDLETNDPRRAGYLSYYILWNLSTVALSLADYKKRFPSAL
jgi:hypothetical protein